MAHINFSKFPKEFKFNMGKGLNETTCKKGEGAMSEIKKGDIVLYPKYSGHALKIDGEEYLILQEDEILGFLR